MVDITILELNLSDSSFSAQAQWGEDEGEVDYAVNDGDDEDEDDTSGGPSTAVAAVAVLVVLAAVAAALKLLGGSDDEATEAETPAEPVGVTVDDE